MEKLGKTPPSPESKSENPTQTANEFVSRWKRRLLGNLDKIYLAGAALYALASAGFALSGNIPLAVAFGSLTFVQLSGAVAELSKKTHPTK